MRLIGGFLHLDGQPAAPERLARMAAAMVEPGLAPRCSEWIEGPTALFTLDFASATASGDRSSLPIPLALDGRFDAPGDELTEASLAARIDRNGAAGLTDLAGDFALAAWNPQSRTLLCARDDFGVRPLFIAHQPGKFFAFASLPRGLHATGLVPRVINPGFIVDDLISQFPRDGYCLFEGIERVPAGSWVRVKLGCPALTRGRHWQLDLAAAGTRRISPADAAAELSGLVEAAVRRRLPPSGPAAAHLTGGLDSSAMAILAARALRPEARELHAYSLVPRPFRDFRFGGHGRYIESVLNQEPDIVWHPARIESPRAFVLPHMDQDQLFPDDPAFPEVAVFADAAKRGATVLLSGWGGDDGASYNQRGVLAEALLHGHWRYLAGEFKAIGARASWHAMSPYLLHPAIMQFVRRLSGRGQSGVDAQSTVLGLLHPRYALNRQPIREWLIPDARRIRYELLSRPAIPFRAEKWALLGARHGIAPSFPLLDRKVVEFALSVPSDLFFREGWARRLFRDAMADVLPDDLQWKQSKLDVASEGQLHYSAEAAFLGDFLQEVRSNPVAGELFDLDRMNARLRALPPPENLARVVDTGKGDRTAFVATRSLQQAFRTLSFLQHHAA